MTVIPQEGDWEQDVVTIPVDEYIKLQEEAKFLHLLHQFGVDEWNLYEAALKMWRDN